MSVQRSASAPTIFCLFSSSAFTFTLTPHRAQFSHTAVGADEEEDDDEDGDGTDDGDNDDTLRAVEDDDDERRS